jgi:P4 family phage/plasmid primase-like protien
MSARSNVIPFGKGRQRHAVARDDDLTPEHREYIKARGIDLETAKRAGLYSHKGRLKIPYQSLDGSPTKYVRSRRFRGRPKFIQPKRTDPHFYFAPLERKKWTKIAKNTDTTIYMCEAEFRALALAQNDLAAIGLGGVYGWLRKDRDSGKSQPLDDFEQITWRDRRVVLVFDADVLTKIEVQKALRQLSAHLRKLDAEVFIKVIPDLGDGKTGADDFIAARGFKAFEKLRERPADHPKFDTWGLSAKPANTDAGNARRFVVDHGDNARFVHDWGKWLFWDGTLWRVDKLRAAITLALQTVRNMHREALDLPDRTESKELAKHAYNSESRARLEAMVALASALPPIAMSSERLDQDRWLLAVRNGTVDLRTGKLITARPEDLMTKQAGCEFDADATCPRWQQFVLEVMDGDEDMAAFMQRVVGYSLTGDTREQCLFFLHGSGANGKSTFVKTVQALLADYERQCQAETFMQRDRSGANNDLAKLHGARLAVTPETEEGSRLAESLIKQVTGQDKLSTRFLFQEFFEFVPQFKLFIVGNHRPIIRGDDNAVWRRIRLIPFSVVFPLDKQDKKLDEALRAELPGILNWALEGCCEWQRIGLRPPKKVLSATDEYRESSDVLEQFLDECCEREKGARVPAKRLYDAYMKWALGAGHRPITLTTFGLRIPERGFKKKSDEKGRYYIGLTLLETED